MPLRAPGNNCFIPNASPYVILSLPRPLHSSPPHLLTRSLSLSLPPSLSLSFSALLPVCLSLCRSVFLFLFLSPSLPPSLPPSLLLSSTIHPFTLPSLHRSPMPFSRQASHPLAFFFGAFLFFPPLGLSRRRFPIGPTPASRPAEGWRPGSWIRDLLLSPQIEPHLVDLGRPW
ncbi:hypothetical protein GGS23DRAFT_134479 [Durotheca rogersii]|uniref:uncharacterized protein n=1 Tax=Durotheca rogersii TaxID=419775 RepID=UPI00221FCC28|nr:uncharacterized protein GGS23DRAFT_134479 [Durotheca rogersii]KAI5861842.1 hypothetical protein GGS23DRAFT_134479 [Durotheca rogersii]